MTRLESSAWPLAGGGLSVFALAVAMGSPPWPVGFAVVAAAVLVWAWLSPVMTGAAIGAIAWMCVTGFDVNRFGDIRITGRDDVLRAVVLVLTGVLAAVAHAAVEAKSRYRTADPLWAEFHEPHPATEPNRITGLGVPRPRERALPVRTTEEPRDG